MKGILIVIIVTLLGIVALELTIGLISGIICTLKGGTWHPFFKKCCMPGEWLCPVI